MPGRDYFFQFDAGSEESSVGHFRTAPPVLELASRVRFAFATCQDWPSGYSTAYRDMVKDDLDLVFHLGDYTYEYAIGSPTERGGPPPPGFERETVDLETYRLPHTLSKLDRDLQAAHAAFPFAVIWDDHEVANDYSELAPEWGSPSPEFTARRAAAYQAYYEHMPIRVAVAQTPAPGLRIYPSCSGDASPSSRRSTTDSIEPTTRVATANRTGATTDSTTVATDFVTPAITTGGDGTPYGLYYAPTGPHEMQTDRCALAATAWCAVAGVGDPPTS